MKYKSFFISTALLFMAAIGLFADPVIQITSPTPGSTVAVGSDLILSARPTAENGGVLEVQYLVTYPTTPTIPQLGDPLDGYAYTETVREAGELTIIAQVREAPSVTWVSSSPINIKSVVADNLPSAQITSITNTNPRTRVESGSVVLLRADVTGENGDTNDVDSVQFFVNGASVGTGSRQTGSSIYELEWVPSLVGNADQLAATVVAVVSAKPTPIGISVSSSPVFVNVISGLAPEVNFITPTGDVEIQANQELDLLASATVEDGTIREVQFFYRNTPGNPLSGTSGNLIGTDALTPYSATFSRPSEGSYYIYAVATSIAGRTGFTPTPIKVVVVPGVAPTVGDVQSPVDTVTLGSTLPLSITAGDSDGTIASVDFYNGGVLLGAGTLNGTTTYTLNWTPTVEGTYSITAVATDDTGLIAESAVKTITVAPNAAPTVGDVQVPVDTVTLGSTLPLSITAGDNDGTIASVDFYNGSVKLGAGTLSGSTTYTLDWSPTVVGTYSITAVATDDLGLIAESAVKTITVVAAVGLVPTADISLYPAVAGAQARFVTGSEIAIYVNALDDDGSIASSALYVDGSLLPGNGSTAVYIPATAGSNTITAVVVDNDGNVTASSITIDVVGSGPRPGVSIESPVVDQVFYLGDDIVIRAEVVSAGTNVDTIFVLQDGRLIEVQGSGSAVAPGVYEFTVPQADVQNDIEFRVGASYNISYQVRVGFDALGNPKFDAFDFAKVGLSEPVTIDVLAGAAPEVAITGFADGDKLAYGSTIAVPIRVTPLDSSNTMSVELFANGVSQGFAPSAPYSVNYTVDQTGTIELFAVATETLPTLPNSSTATRRSATVRLISAVGQEPVVSAVQVPVNTVTLGNTVTLSVTAGDSDGTIQSLDFYNGSVLLGAGTLSGGNTYTLAWTPSAAGTYALSAIAKDNAQFIGISAIAPPVTVAANVAPTVGKVQVPVDTVTLGNTVTLSVIAGDSDGSVASVNFYNGSVLLGAAALSSGTTYTLAWTPDTVTTYNVTAIATDNHGLDSGPSAIATPVTVAANAAPTVGNVQVPVGTVTFGNTVTLSVNAGDSDGSVASVNFYNGNVLLGAGALSGGTTYTLAWTPDTVTTYNVTAIATDNHGLDSAPSAIATPVTVAANAAPTVGNVQVPVGTVTFGNTVTLSVTAGDSDGSVASVNFYNDNVLLGAGALSSGTTYTLAWTPDTVTTYNVTAIATDNHGLDSAPSAIATPVTVAANAAPTVGNVQVPVDTVTLGSTLPLSITAGDNDGTIASVDFYNGSVKLGAGTLSGSTTYTLDWSPTVVGTYSITAVATDDLGLIAESAVKTITVVAAVGLVPTADISLYPAVAGAQARFVTGSEIAIYVNALDDDGSIASSALYVDGSLLPGNGSTAVYIPATAGSNTITAVVVDNDGNVASSSITIRVIGSGQRPIVSIDSPVVDQVFYLGDDIVIRAEVDSAGTNVDTIFVLQDGRLIEVQGSGSAVEPDVYEFTVPQADVQDDIEFRVGASYNISYQVFVGVDANGNPKFEAFDFAKVGLSEPVTIDVLAGAAPEVAITGFADGDKLAYGSTIAVPIRVTPLDSSSTMSVELFANGVSQGVASSAPYSVNYTVDQTGTIELFAVATETLPDSSTATRRSATVRLIGAVGQAPVVSAVQVPVNTVTLGNIVTLSVTAGDIDGTIQSLDFYNGSVLLGAGTLSGGNTYTLAWTPSAAGTYALSAIAKDNAQFIGISAIAPPVTVAANVAPTVGNVQVPVGTVTFGNTVTLSVTAGDSDGSVASVNFYNDSVLLGAGALSGGTTYTLAWTPDTVTDYDVTAIATDNHGLDSAPSAIAPPVTVAANVAPTVGNVQVPVGTVTFGNTVTLSVTAGDSDGSVASVNFYNDSVLLGAGALSGGTTYTLAWTPDTVTTYNVTAIATDNHGLDSAPSAIATPVTVAANVAPTVGKVQVPVDTVTLGNTVTLSVIAGDSDGSVASVNFYNDSVLLGAGALSGGTTYTLAWTPDTVTDYDVTAIATDNHGLDSGPSAIATPVTVAANAAPTVGDVQVPVGTVTLGNTVTLSVIAGDSDGSVASVNFYNGSVLLGAGALSSGTTYTLAWTPDTVTTYNVTAIATDNHGLDSVPSAIATTVTVATPAPIVDPIVSFVSPLGDVELVPYEATTGDDTATGGDEVAPEGATVTLRASAAVEGGTISKVEFFYLNAPGNPLLGTLIGADTSAPYTTVFSSGSVGTYYIYAVATSNTGGIGVTTESIQVTVAEPVEPVVTFVAPTAGDIVEIEAREILTLLASAEVEGGTISGGIRFYFRNTPGDPLLGTLIKSVPSAPYTTEFSSLSEGVFYLYAVATSFERITGVTATPIEVRVTYSQDELFINNIFDSILGRSPTDSEVADGLEILDGSLVSQTAYVVDLLDSSALDDTYLAMLVNRTMLGEWPDAEELAFARANLSGGTVGSSSQTGSIEFGATETFEFFYNVGDAVTMRVTQDSSAGNPLTDATLTVNSPNGVQVGYSDDSIFGLDPLLTFTATEAGTHTAIVGGFSQLQAGDFTITSLSTGSGSSNAASAQSLVTALIPEFESRFKETFPPLSVAGQAANNLVTQLFRNKHSTAPSALALSRLSLSLTGVDTNLGQVTVRGYSGTTAAFVAAFALDNQLSQNPGLSSELLYTVPNDATEDMQTALLIATLLEEDPTAALIAEYAGMTIEDVVEAILIESLEPSASTWTPEGWVYYDYPYAYSLDEARWHYFDSSNTQWRVNLTTSEWGTLPEATGWTFYAWPYSYSVDASTWHWYNDNEQWVVDLVSGIWALFGD